MEFQDDDLIQFEAEGAAPLPVTNGQIYIENDGARIWYATYGLGSPVILLHGGLGHSGNWGYQVPALVEHGYRAIVIDSRSHGRSTRDEQPYTYELMASDVVAVMNILKIEKAAFMGWSDGASVAGAIWIHIENLHKIAKRRQIVKKARIYSLRSKKPVLNYGCENTDFGDINVDIQQRNVKNFNLIKPFPKKLPYPDKYFSGVVCNHVLEHINDYNGLINELKRVADEVYIITPNPIFLWTWAWPDHKWVFISNNAVPLVDPPLKKSLAEKYARLEVKIMKFSTRFNI